MSQRKLEYHPPSRDVLVHFAQQVGNELGEDYLDHDVVNGLADFMAVTARILAADLNRKQAGDLVDSQIE